MAGYSIPVLDLEEFTAGGSGIRESFVGQAGDALRDVGFFSLVRHGIDADVIQAATAAAERFFTLPDATKKRYEAPDLKGQRGFTRFGREHAKDQLAPDLKEFWHVGRERVSGEASSEVCPKNIWPEEVPEFERVFVRLYDELERCALEYLMACSLYLELPERTLSDMTVNADSILRVLHYPPVSEGAHGASVRAAAHEDINLITLLCGATDGGLEIRRRDGTWVPVSTSEDAIVVDAGDMLQHLSNGILQSTTHRVVNPDDSGRRRLSMPFFVHPRREVDLTPLESCVARSGGAQRFPAITAGEFLQRRLAEIGLA